MPIKVTALAFDHFILYITAQVPYSTLSSKNTRKEGDCKSNIVSALTVCEFLYTVKNFSIPKANPTG